MICCAQCGCLVDPYCTVDLYCCCTEALSTQTLVGARLTARHWHKQAVCGMRSCIPVRVSEVNGKVDVSVLMITSRGGKGLVFPKVAIA